MTLTQVCDQNWFIGVGILVLGHWKYRRSPTGYNQTNHQIGSLVLVNVIVWCQHLKSTAYRRLSPIFPMTGYEKNRREGESGQQTMKVSLCGLHDLTCKLVHWSNWFIGVGQSKLLIK